MKNMEDLTAHKFILLCGDNSNALGLCRSLGEKGIEPIVVNYTPKPYLLNHSKYVKLLYQVDSAEDGLKYIITNFRSEKYKPFIYAVDDYVAMLLDQNYHSLLDHFYFCHSQGNLAYYLDKKNLCDIAEECGIPQPKGEVLKKGELPKTLRYPVLTKVTMSTKGAWKNDVFICQNEDELKEAYTHIKADELLVQEYIDKKNELCVDGISLNGGDDIILSYDSEYLRMSKDSFGGYMLMKPYDNEEVCTKIKHIIKRCNYTGIFDFECLIGKNDELYFLEINFRNSAWGYAHTFGGMNLAYYWAKWTLEGKSNITECNIRKEPFTAMSELGDLSYIMRSSDISFFTWLRQFRECDCTYTYNSKDRRPFYYAIWHKLRTAIKHKLMSLFGKYTYKKK